MLIKLLKAESFEIHNSDHENKSMPYNSDLRIFEKRGSYLYTEFKTSKGGLLVLPKSESTMTISLLSRHYYNLNMLYR